MNAESTVVPRPPVPRPEPSPVLSREWLHCLATSPDGAPLGYFRLVSGETVPRLEIRTDGDSVRLSIPGAYLTTGDKSYDFDSLVMQPDGGVLVRYGDGETAVVQ